jgi:hypothetical protein
MRQSGITFGPGDLTYAEAVLLDMLNQEREKFTEEQMREATSKRR